MKRVVISIMLIGVLNLLNAGCFSSSSEKKYSDNKKDGSVTKVLVQENNSDECKRYAYIHIKLSGTAHTSTCFSEAYISDAKATTWITSGSNTRDCGIEYKLAELGLVEYLDASPTPHAVRKFNVSSVSISPKNGNSNVLNVRHNIKISSRDNSITLYTYIRGSN